MRNKFLTLAIGGALAAGLSTAALAQGYTYYTYEGSYPTYSNWQTYHYPYGYYRNPVTGAANTAGNIVGGALNAAGSIVGGTLNAAGNIARGVTTPYYGYNYGYYGGGYPAYNYGIYSGEYPAYTYWGWGR